MMSQFIAIFYVVLSLAFTPMLKNRAGRLDIDITALNYGDGIFA